MTNSERASYIRGLMDGLELDPEAKETKVLNAVVELLDDLCQSMDELEDDVAEICLLYTSPSPRAWRKMSAAVAAAITNTGRTRISRTPCLR